ncbi:hypothetical protein [Lysinibacillus macroides]|uniref:hypothetical protein n=1 Tax=Lysinibacillus macroides TaxID=33935 RepID=UPI000AF7AC38|nr:hypothetical protein [Lysinibacillus macroides]
MTIISLQHVTKDYGHGRGIFNVSFNVEKGTVYGFLGPNGACICRQICEEGKPSQQIT